MSLASTLGLSRASRDDMAIVGFELFHGGDLRGAAAVFEGLLALDPEDSVAMGGLGAVSEAQGDLARATDLYARALELRPENLLAQRGRVRALASLAARGRAAEAAGPEPPPRDGRMNDLADGVR
jgi:Flp pilus assembly protein TadD